jgi:hypothetical protein
MGPLKKKKRRKMEDSGDLVGPLPAVLLSGEVVPWYDHPSAFILGPKTHRRRRVDLQHHWTFSLQQVTRLGNRTQDDNHRNFFCRNQYDRRRNVTKIGKPVPKRSWQERKG